MQCMRLSNVLPVGGVSTSHTSAARSEPQETVVKRPNNLFTRITRLIRPWRKHTRTFFSLSLVIRVTWVGWTGSVVVCVLLTGVLRRVQSSEPNVWLENRTYTTQYHYNIMRYKEEAFSHFITTLPLLILMCAGAGVLVSGVYWDLCECVFIRACELIREEETVLTHLSILIAVSSRVFEVLTGAFITVRVQVDGARRSLGQKLVPDLLRPGGHVLERPPLQVLHCQPEPAAVSMPIWVNIHKILYTVHGKLAIKWQPFVVFSVVTYADNTV